MLLYLPQALYLGFCLGAGALQQAERVIVKLVLAQDGQKTRLEVEGSADEPSGLAAKIVEAISRRSRHVEPKAS